MLEVKALKYEYENINFSFNLTANKGEITALIGKSGAGKSTLLSLMAGFLKPKSGDILLHNNSIIYQDIDKRDLSILFQENNLFAHLNLRDNIALGISPDLKLSATDEQCLRQGAQIFGIEKLLNHLPSAVSGGQKQRAGLCRVLLRKKSLLLLDEPFSALDTQTKDELLEELKAITISQNLIVIMVTHNREDAKKVASSVVELEDGKTKQMDIGLL